MGCCQDWRHGSGCSADCPPPATAVCVASADMDAIHDRIAAAEKEIARLKSAAAYLGGSLELMCSFYGRHVEYPQGADDFFRELEHSTGITKTELMTWPAWRTSTAPAPSAKTKRSK